MKSGDSVKDQPNDNGPNSNLKSNYSHAKSTWMLEYGMTKLLPRHMNSILVEALYTFMLSVGNIIRFRFVKTKLLPIILSGLTTNTQEFTAFVQVYSGTNAKEINGIARHTVALIEVEEIRNDCPMVFL